MYLYPIISKDFQGIITDENLTETEEKELLKNNVGILVKDRNKEKMAEEIIKELKNKNGSEHSEKGYKYCQKYLLDNVKKEWINILK